VPTFSHTATNLQVDPETAKLEADKVEDNEELRKKLWLMIAKHVVQQGKATKGENIRKAIAFLKETDGLLKIEDILPFFPDFSLIDDFKVFFSLSLTLSEGSSILKSFHHCTPGKHASACVLVSWNHYDLSLFLACCIILILCALHLKLP
jgi:hypothetical protein